MYINVNICMNTKRDFFTAYLFAFTSSSIRAHLHFFCIIQIFFFTFSVCFNRFGKIKRNVLSRSFSQAAVQLLSLRESIVLNWVSARRTRFLLRFSVFLYASMCLCLNCRVGGCMGMGGGGRIDNTVDILNIVYWM